MATKTPKKDPRRTIPVIPGSKKPKKAPSRKKQ